MNGGRTTTAALVRATALGGLVLLVMASRADASCASDCGPTAHGWLALVLLAAVLALAGIIVVVASRPSRVLKTRRTAVELAAQRTAEADPAFAPEQVQAAAAELFRDVYAAWNAENRDRLGQLLGTDLLQEWSAELDKLSRQGLQKRVIARGKLTIDYVALDRPAGNHDAAVVVRIVTLLGTSIGSSSETHDAKVTTKGTEEYWTLTQRDHRWTVTAIEGRKDGRRHLDEPIVTGLSVDLPRIAG